MGRVPLHPAYQQQLATEFAARRRTFDEIYAQAVQPGFAQAFASQANMYPYARPGLLYGMTAAGIPAGDPVANQIAEMSFTQSIAEDPSFALPDGQQVQESVQKAPAAQGEGVAGFLYDGVKSLVRGTAMGLWAPFEEIGRAVTSAGEAALDGDDDGFINDFWANMGQASPSHLSVALGEFYHRVTSGEIDFTDPQSLRENLWSGDPEFIGSGLLPAGDVGALREERKQNLQLNGQFLTPGRTAVEFFDRGQWIERGSTTYNWVSGAADFAANLFADPVNYVPVAGQAVKGARISRATAALADEPVNLVRQVGRADEVAEFGAGWRRMLMKTPVRTVDGDGMLWEFSSGSRDANQLMAALTQESSPTLINRAFGGNLPRQMAVDLADTSDPLKIAERLRQAIIEDLDVAAMPQLSRSQRAAVRANGAMSDPTSFKPVLRRHSDRFTWATLIPNHETRVLGTANDTEIAATADRFINHYRASESIFTNADTTQNFAEATEFADRIMRITPGPEAQSELGNILKESMEAFTARTGVESPAIRQMISRDATYVAESKSYLASLAAGRMGRPGQRYSIHLPDGTVKKGRLKSGETSLPAVVGGEVIPLADPIRLNELVQNYTVLPDWRDIRRASSVLSELDFFKGVYGVADAARSFTKNLWMPAVLLRPAITTRILLDGQIRTSFDGLPSVFNHPVEFFATMMSRKGIPKYDKTIMGADFADIDHFKEAMEGLSFAGFTGKGGHMIPAHFSTDYSHTVERATDPRSWMDSSTRHLIRLANSPSTRKLASDGLDATADWMIDGGGRHILDTMNRQVYDGQIQTRDDVLSWLRTDMADLEYITGANPMLMHDIANGRVAGIRVTKDWDPQTGLVRESMTPDPDYFEQVRKGLSDNPAWLDAMPASLQGSKSVSAGLMGSWDKFKTNVNELQNFMFDTTMTRPENFTTRSPAYRATYYRVIRDLMPRLSREEALDVVRRVRQYGNVAGPDNKFYRSFVKSGRRELDELEAMARKLPVGGLNADRVVALDRLAGQEAARETLDLLYDLGRRRLWEDAFAVGAPFMAVWADTIKTYAHPTKGVLTSNPRMFNRFSQGLQGARSADPDGDGRTFIYQDQNGEEQFVIPDWAMAVAMGAVAGVAGGVAGAVAGSTAAAAGRQAVGQGARQAIGGAIGGASARVAQQAGQRGGGLAAQQLASRALPSTGGELLRRGGAVAGGAAGMAFSDRQFDKARDLGGTADIEFTGRPAGLNVAASTILPGAGPVVQIPLSYLVERTPSLDWVWDKVFPFGRPNVEGGVAESLFPAYMKRFTTMIRDDPDSVRLFGGVVADVSSALLASGDYTRDEFGVLTDEAKNQLLEDATERARAIFIVRGMAQSTLPTGPEIEFTAETEFGEMTFVALADEYRRLRDQYGGDVATGEFIARFGVDLLGVTLAKTRTIRARSFNPEGADWERQNGDLVESYSNTIEFFAPDDGTDDFDFSAYNRANDRGDSVAMSPEDRIRVLNNIIGSAYMRSQRNLMGDAASTPAGRVYLREERARLVEAYPGYGAVDNLPSAINTEAAIGELQRAVSDEDPRIAGLPVTKAVREYLGLREQATQAALAINGATFQKSLDGEIVELRDALRREAARIMLETPEFADVWLRVFERELADDIGLEEESSGPVPFDRWPGPAPLLGVTT